MFTEPLAEMALEEEKTWLAIPKYMNSTLEHNESFTVNKSQEKVKQIEQLWEQLDVTRLDS